MEKKFNKTILIVEDEAPLRRAIALAFNAAGFDTIVAQNGKEGFASLLSRCPDLVVLDIVMPVMDGLTMLSEVRKNDVCTHIPVIIFTNLMVKEIQLKASELNAHDCFSKTDNSLAELINRAKELLNIKE